MSERSMAIIQPIERPSTTRQTRAVRVASIPWTMFSDASERQAQENHGQTLAGLASRGGLDASEAVCILSNMHWRDYSLSADQSHRILYAMRVMLNRGALLASPSPAQASGSRKTETPCE